LLWACCLTFKTIRLFLERAFILTTKDSLVLDVIEQSPLLSLLFYLAGLLFPNIFLLDLRWLFDFSDFNL